MRRIKLTTIISLILVILMASCQSEKKEKKETTSIDTTSSTQDYELTKVDLFEDYILALDSTDINSISKTTTKFKSLFTPDDSIQNDHGILLFLAFQEKVELNGNIKVITDSKDYGDLVGIEFNDKKAPTELAEFHKSINANSFRIDQAEGMYFIKANPAYIEQNFYMYASPTMEIYLRQLAKENQEGFAKDAAISIPFEILVQRVIWWEDFSDSIHHGPLKATARTNYKNYLTFLTVGLNNTPAINHEDKPEPYFIDAYAYLKEVYPKSSTYEELKPYIELIQQGNVTEAKELGLQLIRQTAPFSNP